jgi:hypothetical protein
MIQFSFAERFQRADDGLFVVLFTIDLCIATQTGQPWLY